MKTLLGPLAAAYGLAMRIRSGLYRYRILRSRKLNRPVISVGNLAVGGTGKTPLVALVARLMLQRGLKPAILTRGYRRRRGLGSNPAADRLLALAPSSSRHPDPRKTGDEPALLASALPEVPIVISADRFRAGRFAEKHWGVGVHILDDGFQHLALARNLDIVTLDATSDLSALLPKGRLREPLSALRRADLVVITRSELADPNRLREIARRIHPGAPVFTARTTLASVSNLSTGKRLPPEALQGQTVFAFCGLGNPRAFFQNLAQWGMHLAGTRVFRDHHRYSARDLASLCRSAADAGTARLITTLKDFMNFPSAWKMEAEFLACETEMEVLDLPGFEAALRRSLS